jgi:P27 family predicted phage terminase small subunit
VAKPLPVPTQLRIVGGDRSHRPPNEDEPRPSIIDPELPYFLAGLDADYVRPLLALLTVKQLKAQAKALNLKGYSRLKRADLEDRLADHVPGPRTTAWRYLLKVLAPMRIVTPSDGAALALGVDALVEYVDLARILQSEGRFWTTKDGRYGRQVKRHPAVDAIGKAWARVLAILDRFGANPAYRAKVKSAADDTADGAEWDELDSLGH